MLTLSSPFTSFQTKFKLGIGHFEDDGHLDGEIQELYILIQQLVILKQQVFTIIYFLILLIIALFIL